MSRYATARKIGNMFRAYGHYRRGDTRIPTRPCFLKAEISRKCDIDCLYCPIPQKEDVFMPFSIYQDLVNSLSRDLFLVSLYDIGDPLHHPLVIDCVHAAHRAGVGAVLSTSLSIEKPDAFWKDLARSQVDRLIVAIDGLTSEIYRQYRTRGNLRLVMDNLQRLLSYRAECGRRTFIEWQMVDLPWNRHQQAEAKALSGEMGCDAFRVIPEAVLPRRQYESQGQMRRSNCLLPYLVLIVTAHQEVRPCYKLYTAPNFVGDLKCHGPETVWNGPGMAGVRSKTLIQHRRPCRTCRE